VGDIQIIEQHRGWIKEETDKNKKEKINENNKKRPLIEKFLYTKYIQNICKRLDFNSKLGSAQAFKIGCFFSFFGGNLHASVSKGCHTFISRKLVVIVPECRQTF
jgi:hypothetical protein